MTASFSTLNLTPPRQYSETDYRRSIRFLAHTQSRLIFPLNNESGRALGLTHLFQQKAKPKEYSLWHTLKISNPPPSVTEMIIFGDLRKDIEADQSFDTGLQDAMQIFAVQPNNSLKIVIPDAKNFSNSLSYNFLTALISDYPDSVQIRIASSEFLKALKQDFNAYTGTGDIDLTGFAASNGGGIRYEFLSKNTPDIFITFNSCDSRLFLPQSTFKKYFEDCELLPG